MKNKLDGTEDAAERESKIKSLLAQYELNERERKGLDQEDDWEQWERLDDKSNAIEDELEAMGCDMVKLGFCSSYIYDPEDPRPKSKKLSANKNNPFANDTAYGHGHLPILAIMHGSDVHHGKRFQREDPRDRKAFCDFVRGYLTDNFAHILHDNKDSKKHLEQAIKMKYPDTDTPPGGFDPDNRWHLAYRAALHNHKTPYSDMRQVRACGERGRQFMEKHHLAQEVQCAFQLGLVLLSNEYEDLGLRDLRVLCAVNSCLENGFGQIHLSVLCTRAVGATSQEQAALLGVEPLTEMQVRRALDALTARGLIQRLTVGRTMYAAKGNMPEHDFHALVSSNLLKGKSKQGFIKGGKLHLVATVA